MSEHEIITRFRAEGVDDVIAANAAIIQQTKQLKDSGVTYGTQVSDLSQAMRDNMSATYALRRGYMGIRTDVRMSHMALIDFASSMNNVANIGRDVNSIFATYNTAQLRITTAQQSLSTANQDVAYWQNLYNKYLNDFGADASYTIKTQEKLTSALDAQKKAQQSVTDAQNDMNKEYVAWVLMAPAFLANAVQIGIKLKELAGYVAANGGLAATIGGSTAALASIAVGGAGAAYIGGQAGAALGEPIAKAAVSGLSPMGTTNALINRITNPPSGVPNVFTGETGLRGATTVRISDEIVRALTDAGKAITDFFNPSNANKSGNQTNNTSITVNQSNTLNNVADAQKAADSAYQGVTDQLRQRGVK